MTCALKRKNIDLRGRRLGDAFTWSWFERFQRNWVSLDGGGNEARYPHRCHLDWLMVEDYTLLASDYRTRSISPMKLTTHVSKMTWPMSCNLSAPCLFNVLASKSIISLWTSPKTSHIEPNQAQPSHIKVKPDENLLRTKSKWIINANSVWWVSKRRP